MRNISFALTQRQFRDRTKDVTRRLGWAWLKGGEELMGCEKCQGLKPGERIVRMGPTLVVSARRERLDAIDQADVIREGFPELTPKGFLSMFRLHMGPKGSPGAIVTRIEYRYLPLEGINDL